MFWIHLTVFWYLAQSSIFVWPSDIPPGWNAFEMCKSLAGIKNYNDVCESTGVREYDELSDKGTGTSFWNGYSVGGFNSSGGLGCPLISLARLKIPEMTFSFLSLEVCVCVLCVKTPRNRVKWFLNRWPWFRISAAIVLKKQHVRCCSVSRFPIDFLPRSDTLKFTFSFRTYKQGVPGASMSLAPTKTLIVCLWYEERTLSSRTCSFCETVEQAVILRCFYFNFRCPSDQLPTEFRSGFNKVSISFRLTFDRFSNSFDNSTSTNYDN